MDTLKLRFFLNTNAGIMANMPLDWWDSVNNHMNVVPHKDCVYIEVEGDKDVVIMWLLNLGRDGRYRYITYDQFQKL